jgi:hypothetical protein
MTFESFKTTKGFCHINNEKIVFSLDNFTEKVSDIEMLKHNTKCILKLAFAISLFYFSYESFNNHKIYNGILNLIIGLIFLYEIINLINKWNYLIRKRISKNTIRKINLESNNILKINYLNEKNIVKTFCIKMSKNRIENERVLEKLNNKNSY